MSNPPPLPPPPPAHRLDYEQAQQRRPINVLLHTTMAIVATLLICIPMGVALFVVPRFEAVFKDFRTELPYITQLVLGFSRWMVSGYGWMLVLPLPVLFVFLGVMLDLRSPTGAEARIYYRVGIRLLIFALLLAGVFTAIACIMPMVSLMDAVSGSARK